MGRRDRSLRALLPDNVQATQLVTRGRTTGSPEYEEACLVFYRRHVCLVDPFPACVERTFADLSREVYETMNGPSEFHVTGTLREWSVVPRLGEISVPALVVSGEHDEATPAISHTVYEGIRGSELVILDGCSHMAHLEQPERYLALLDTFFGRVAAVRVSRDGPLSCICARSNCVASNPSRTWSRCASSRASA